MQTRSSDENSVSLPVGLSVCPSNAWIVTKREKGLSRLLYHTKAHSLVFCEDSLVEGDLFYLKFLVNRRHYPGLAPG